MRIMCRRVVACLHTFTATRTPVRNINEFSIDAMKRIDNVDFTCCHVRAMSFETDTDTESHLHTLSHRIFQAGAAAWIH